MGKKEGCNKMSKKTHFVTAPLLALLRLISRVHIAQSRF